VSRTSKTMKNARYLEVDARVRYWEDATVGCTVDGVYAELSDADGRLIPLRDGDSWKPIIDLQDGKILNWPAGYTADIHYKVADDGDYYLLNELKQRVAKWSSHYVPVWFLYFDSDSKDDDYITMTVDANGSIENYKKPDVLIDEWDRIGPTLEQHAKNVYELYCESVGGKAFNGDPLPTWEEFSNDPMKVVQQAAWLAIGAYVTEQV
jgi:hypothetical protein